MGETPGDGLRREAFFMSISEHASEAAEESAILGRMEGEFNCGIRKKERLCLTAGHETTPFRRASR